MPLGGVIFLFIFIFCFGLFLLFVASKLGGKKTQDAVKLSAYECGLPAQENRTTKISVKFYLTAILFILFDIEIIFMYPWATTFKDFLSTGSGATVFWSMMIFIAVFIFGLFWEVKSKALEWD